MPAFSEQFIALLVSGLIGPLVVGLVIWELGKREQQNRIRSEAIRDLMTYRGSDFSSPEFLISLNKISITFQDSDEIRMLVRTLYEAISYPGTNEKQTKRKIVGLIYVLCQNYGFKHISEYDIDQAFPESIQIPQVSPKSTQAPEIKSITKPPKRLKK